MCGSLNILWHCLSLGQKRERELMERMGFTPHTLEDNNGKPAYTEEDEE